ncbi:MAG: hypothetical protein ACRDKT_12705 [Actinomycetota bacterium]
MTAPEHTARSRTGIGAGILAGVVGLFCCVGPSVAALVGITSAAVAVDLANDLYREWSWAFRGAGALTAAAAIAIVARRQRRCSTIPLAGSRFVAIVLVTAIATYGALYAATTWLGDRAVGTTATSSPIPAIIATGATIAERVDSARRQLRVHYPHVDIDVQFAGRGGVAASVVWWDDLPSGTGGDYAAVIQRRVDGSREAGIVFLQAVAKAVPSMTSFSLFEDRSIMPIWSRDQILGIGTRVRCGISRPTRRSRRARDTSVATCRSCPRFGTALVVIEFLFPRSDTAVVAQAVMTAIVVPIVLVRLIRRRRTDLVWFVAGVITIWVALMGLRTLH